MIEYVRNYFALTLDLVIVWHTGLQPKDHRVEMDR